jgi:hypothetical protein
MSTSLFEALLLLKVNSQHWKNVFLVGEQTLGKTKRMESVTTNSTIDVNGDDIDEDDVFHSGNNSDPDLESFAHS